MGCIYLPGKDIASKGKKHCKFLPVIAAFAAPWCSQLGQEHVLSCGGDHCAGLFSPWEKELLAAWQELRRAASAVGRRDGDTCSALFGGFGLKVLPELQWWKRQQLEQSEGCGTQADKCMSLAGTS